ncbi:hypothetical protein DNH61_21415 [Paenibacillus sambharensis]|uniref:Uncharacterized protein n=1 Tax=Paenibacillus sambharensis TaxID=1803190 RepID=A0A2W1LH29_9BACL|nr:hypothetical protein [Paenibacillus sambharensis]PZD93764.1 hypothetical protein DNH61_21415 [Paenibacillus sambharensis]
MGIRSYMLGAALMISMLLSTTVEAAVPDEVQAYAENEGIASFKARMGEDPEAFDLKQSQLDQAELGMGFETYRVDHESLKSADRGDTLQSMLVKNEEWTFVVMSEGAPLSLFTVQRDNNGLEVISGGGAARELMNAYHSFTTQYPNSNPKLAEIKGIQLFVGNSPDGSEVFLSSLEHAAGVSSTEIAPTSPLVAALIEQLNAPNQDHDGGADGLIRLPRLTWVWVTIGIIIGLLLLAAAIRHSKHKHNPNR